MGNIKRGWFTTTIGAILMICSVLVGFGFVNVHREVSDIFLGATFVLGILLCRSPKTVEDKLLKLFNKKTDTL